MTDQVNAEWHVSEVNNPAGCLTITYIENGHMVRVNMFQPADPVQLETAVMQAWPHEQFKAIHAAGMAPHPTYAKMIAERHAVADFRRPAPATPAVSTAEKQASQNVEEM